ncbi:MAG: hypothetical protein RIF33_13525 [Cyclobacteriaceae bacterium]
MSIQQHQDIHIPIISAPGDTIMETMEIKGISVEELAKGLQLDGIEIRALLHGEIAIDMDLAYRLAEQLQIPASFWINREKDYQKERKQTTTA